MEIRTQNKIGKAIMTNRLKFRVGNIGHAYSTTLLAPGFQTSVLALATLWAPSDQK